MKHDFNSLYEGPRLQRKSRKRKTNLFISLVMIGGLLSFLILANPFTSTVEDSLQPTITDEAETNKDHQEMQGKNKEDTEINRASTLNTERSNQKKANDSLVLDTVENKWAPIGTVQTEPHQTSFEKGSVDWNEMVKAASMATELEVDDMIVWWLGNGGSENTSTATVSSTDQQEIYRVSMEWVKNEGWMPTVVERLIENDIIDKNDPEGQ